MPRRIIETDSAMKKADGHYRRIYRVVARIPRGRVATYGQIAEMAGLPGQARQVGFALHALDDSSSLPWHRVINAKGEVSPRAEPIFEDLQRSLLRGEGLVPDERGRFSLRKYLWSPRRKAASIDRKLPKR